MAINPVRDYSIKCHPSDDEKTTFTEAIEDFFSMNRKIDVKHGQKYWNNI